MENDKLDPVQFGRLIESVERLTVSVNNLTVDIDSLKQSRSRGWGIISGVALAAGGLGSFAHSAVERLIK